MYTCKVCNYALTISKSNNLDTVAIINNPQEFCKVFAKTSRSKKDQNVDMMFNITIDSNLLKTYLNGSNYKEDVKTMLLDKLENIKKNTSPNTFCLKCSQCDEKFMLPPGKIMSIKIRKSSGLQHDNIVEIIEDPTLLRTKDFVCPNKKCNVPDDEKEAVIFRPNPEEYTTQYICVNCQTVF